MSLRRPHLSLLPASGLVLLAALLSVPLGAADDSPFLPPAGATAAVKNTASSGYELAGMTQVGKTTLLSITRLSDKHSTWVPVGQTVAEITVVSYDAKADSAVIKADNQTLTLTMRKGAVVAGPANPTPSAPPPSTLAGPPPPPPVSPAAAVPPKALTQQEEKELEARMLVTDLLEIGQQQRKAYEEAQRQAALKAANPKMPSAPAVQPTKR